MTVQIKKYNPYHDEMGRFTTSDGAYFISTSGVFDAPSDTPSRSMDSAPSDPTQVLRDINEHLNKVPPPIPPPRGKDVRQPIPNSIDALYDSASEGFTLYEGLMGKLSKAVQSRDTHRINTPDDYEKAMADLKDGPKGLVTLIAGLKGKERLQQKVGGYGGDYTRVGDVVRGTIATDTLDEIDDVVEALIAQGGRLARDPTNRYATPTLAGYRDVMLNVKLSNGHVAELQINTKEMLLAKDVGHPIYEKERTITDRALAENRELTPQEDREVSKLRAQQKSIYDAAWQRILDNG